MMHGLLFRKECYWHTSLMIIFLFFFVERQEPRGALIAFQEHILHHLELLPQVLAMTVMLANYKPALV